MIQSSTAAAWASAIAAIITAFIGYQVFDLDRQREAFLRAQITLSAIESHKSRMDNIPTAFSCGYALNEFPSDAFESAVASTEHKKSVLCKSTWCRFYRLCINENIEDDSEFTFSETTARMIIVPIRKALQSYELLTNHAALQSLDRNLILNDLKTELHCRNPFLVYLMRSHIETVKEQYPGLTQSIETLYPKEFEDWAKRIDQANISSFDGICGSGSNAARRR